MRTVLKSNIGKIINWISIVVLLILLMLLVYRHINHHRWYMLYEDTNIKVERCSICGQERFYKVTELAP